MLATLQSVLRKAQRGGYAVGAFNVSNLEQVQGVIRAAESLRSPVIINTSEKAIEYAGLEALSSLVRTLAAAANVPVVLDLDHGRRPKIAIACLRAGYSGLMFDGSTLPYGRNVAQTRLVASAAKRQGVGTEGELGQVKYPADLRRSPTLVMTNPEQAVDFVKKTGICALAVAIGNSHVIPRDRLDFALLRTIRDRVRVPLVLHGASGTAPASIRRAIRLGVAKINIDTDLRQSFTRAVRRSLRTPGLYDPREYLARGRDGLQRTVAEKIRLFGSQGRGR